MSGAGQQTGNRSRSLRPQPQFHVVAIFRQSDNKGACDDTVIAEIFVRVKISYSSVCQLSYARNFRTATVVSDTLLYVYGFRMLLNFVLSAKSTKYTKLNRVRNFVRLQYSNTQSLGRNGCESSYVGGECGMARKTRSRRLWLHYLFV